MKLISLFLIAWNMPNCEQNDARNNALQIESRKNVVRPRGMAESKCLIRIPRQVLSQTQSDSPGNCVIRLTFKKIVRNLEHQVCADRIQINYDLAGFGINSNYIRYLTKKLSQNPPTASQATKRATWQPINALPRLTIERWRLHACLANRARKPASYF